MEWNEYNNLSRYQLTYYIACLCCCNIQTDISTPDDRLILHIKRNNQEGQTHKKQIKEDTVWMKKNMMKSKRIQGHMKKKCIPAMWWLQGQTLCCVHIILNKKMHIFPDLKMLKEWYNVPWCCCTCTKFDFAFHMLFHEVKKKSFWCCTKDLIKLRI